MIPLYTLNMSERTLESIRTARSCGSMTVREHRILDCLERACIATQGTTPTPREVKPIIPEDILTLKGHPDVYVVSREDVRRIVDMWCDDADPVKLTGLWLAPMTGGGWEAVDCHAECIVEDFKHRSIAVEWLRNPEMTTEDAHRMDDDMEVVA